MNSKNIIIGVLLLTTISGGIYGWMQHRQVTALTAQAAKSATAAKSSSKRSPRSSGGDAQQRPAAPQPAADQSQAPADQRPPSPPSSGAIRTLMQSPKATQLMASQQRAIIENRYAALFKTLDLPPDQLAKFKDLLVEKQNAARDVFNVAREQGLDFRNDRAEIQQLIQQAQADVDTNIVSVIGSDKLAQYQNYDQTAPQRAVAGQVEQRMSYTSEPLTSAQSDQLVALLAQNTPPPDNSGNRAFVFNLGGMGPVSFGGSGGVPITNDVINAAQTFLSPGQVDALRQMQAEQADQQQLQQMFRDNGGGGGSGGGGSSGSKYRGKSRRGSGGGGGGGG